MKNLFKVERKNNVVKKEVTVTAYFREEMLKLFRGEFENEFFLVRLSEDSLTVRYPLTDTWFRVRVDFGISFHWHITESNCRWKIDSEEEMTFDECVDFIKKHRYGNSMPVYFSYA